MERALSWYGVSGRGEAMKESTEESMRERIARRGRNRITQKWDDVRVSDSGTLYIERSDVLRRRIRTFLEQRRREKAKMAD